MEANIAICSASEKDIDSLYALELLCHHPPWSNQIFRNEFTNPDSFHFLASLKNNQIIGYFLSWKVVDELHIHKMGIHPDFRRNGFARLIVTTILSEASKQGVVVAFLEVRESNIPAISLYHKIGFEDISKRFFYYDNKENGIIMKKVLIL